MSFSVSRLFGFAVALLFSALSLTAQFDSGQISGFVRDQTSAIVPGASVTATNEGTKEAHRTVTNAEGYYVFPQLVVGSYSIAIEARGFKHYVKTGISLNAEAKVSAEVELTVGAASESVEVTASSADVQTDSAQIATTIETKQMQDLTLNGRNPIYLAALSPGLWGEQSERSTPTASATAASTSTAGGPTSTWLSLTVRWPLAHARRAPWWAR